jgi:hypothetical protein
MPVSRGRKPKKQKKRSQRTQPPVRRVASVGSEWSRPADAEFSRLSASPFRISADVLASFSGQGREPDWWEPSHERVIAASRGLLAAASPRALEQAVAELVGGELYAAMSEGRTGLRFDAWVMELTGRLVSRIADAVGRGAGQDGWQGPWRLLRGLAAIGSYGLGGWIEQEAAKAVGSLPSDWQASQPGWLVSVTEIEATGDVRAMRDAYGTRFGVIAEFRYPGGIDPAWYLFDIDASGFITLAGLGVFDDADHAAGAWQKAVGVSAEGLTPVPPTPEVLACLVYFESEEHLLEGTESRMQMDNWFRGPRRIGDLIRALSARGVELPAHRSLYHDIDFEPMADASPPGTPSATAARPPRMWRRRWRESGWRGCCPVPSTRFHLAGHRSTVGSSVTGVKIPLQTRR